MCLENFSSRLSFVELNLRDYEFSTGCICLCGRNIDLLPSRFGSLMFVDSTSRDFRNIWMSFLMLLWGLVASRKMSKLQVSLLIIPGILWTWFFGTMNSGFFSSISFVWMCRFDRFRSWRGFEFSPCSNSKSAPSQASFPGYDMATTALRKDCSLSCFVPLGPLISFKQILPFVFIVLKFVFSWDLS